MMAKIPMTADLAEWIGNAAEHVENRSLLLEKFCFHKCWPKGTNNPNQPQKWDDASRWSFVRVANGGDKLLRNEAAGKRDRAGGRNASPANREQWMTEAALADQLAKTRTQSGELISLRAAQSRRWLSLLQSSEHTRPMLIAGKLESRMAINLADSLIQNAGICMDRLFGMPYIPGSAIKGVCRHVALAELRDTDSAPQPMVLAAFVQIFGCSDADWKRGGELEEFSPMAAESLKEDRRGGIIFLPAYPLDEAAIEVDLTNVHYPGYYQTGNLNKLRNERPLPNPFPAIKAGTHFLFGCLPGPRATPELLEKAAAWLKAAITIHGIGAKTASGYGWFSIPESYLEDLLNEQAAAEEDRLAKQAAVAEMERQEAVAAAVVASMSPLEREMHRLKDLPDEAFALTAKELANAESLTAEAFLTLLRDDKDKRDRWKSWKKKKPDIVTTIQSAAKKLTFLLP